MAINCLRSTVYINTAFFGNCLSFGPKLSWKYGHAEPHFANNPAHLTPCVVTKKIELHYFSTFVSKIHIYIYACIHLQFYISRVYPKTGHILSLSVTKKSPRFNPVHHFIYVLYSKRLSTNHVASWSITKSTPSGLATHTSVRELCNHWSPEPSIIIFELELNEVKRYVNHSTNACVKKMRLQCRPYFPASMCRSNGHGW